MNKTFPFGIQSLVNNRSCSFGLNVTRIESEKTEWKQNLVLGVLMRNRVKVEIGKERRSESNRFPSTIDL